MDQRIGGTLIFRWDPTTINHHHETTIKKNSADVLYIASSEYGLLGFLWNNAVDPLILPLSLIFPFKTPQF